MLTTTTSRNVNGYVAAAVRAKRWRARYEAKIAALEPLKRKAQVAEERARMKRVKLRGAQLGLAERMVAERLPLQPTGTGRA